MLYVCEICSPYCLERVAIFSALCFSSFFPLCGKYLCIGSRIYFVASYHSMVFRCLVKCSFGGGVVSVAHHSRGLSKNRAESAQWKFVFGNFKHSHPYNKLTPSESGGNGKHAPQTTETPSYSVHCSMCTEENLSRQKLKLSTAFSQPRVARLRRQYLHRSKYTCEKLRHAHV